MTQGDPMATTRLTMGANGEGAGAPMSALPEDDRAREPAIARPADPDLLHLAVVGDTYTVLLSGEQTAGRLAMLDMLIPPGGGPPPHRHDFEECFRVLEGRSKCGCATFRLSRWRQATQPTSPPTFPTPS